MERADAVELLRGLVAIPSRSGQEAEAAQWLAAQMLALGYDRAGVDEAGNAVGEIGPIEAVRTVVLLGHIDTVPGNIPVRIESTPEGDLLYGRGSVDAKGPLATFVAAGARVGPDWARDANIRVVVVGAVEEEAATSAGARCIAARFDGAREPVPAACVIGEPSHWQRLTLGYKGRLLLDLLATQPMAHTAGPDASIATVVVDMWNWVTAHAAAINAGRDRAFDQLSPSLRRFITATTEDMIDTVDAQVAWRLPIGVAAEALVAALVAWSAAHLHAALPPFDAARVITGEPLTIDGPRTQITLRFRGWENAWRGDRQNALVRSFLTAIRSVDPQAQPGFLVKTGTSDMNVVGPLWKCPIVAYGPGDSALDHTPNEHVSLDEYWRAVNVMEAMLRTFAASS
ncbi:MAG TPA: M20/M25/M40 family metallo-hydrolase [Vicinamibacterales bacterium]|nr:M20/M25/M40 family metallo-hydrolase [Vicinamibacterales bacterium]